MFFARGFKARKFRWSRKMKINIRKMNGLQGLAISVLNRKPLFPRRNMKQAYMGIVRLCATGEWKKVILKVKYSPRWMGLWKKKKWGGWYERNKKEDKFNRGRKRAWEQRSYYRGWFMRNQFASGKDFEYILPVWGETYLNSSIAGKWLETNIEKYSRDIVMKL